MQEPGFEHDEEHDLSGDHVDERWLISYSDMMTLLFGLFVMLYAMSSPNQVKPEDAQKMQTSIRENFGAPAAVAPTPAATPGISPVPPSRNETATQGDVPGERPGKIPVKDEPKDGNDPSANQKARLEDPGAQAPLARANETQDTEDDTTSEELDRKLHEAKGRADKLSKELAKASAAMASQQAEVDKSNQKIAELEAQLNSLKEQLNAKAAGPLPGDGENKRSFISAFIQWETEKHDVDMVIVHPNGKRFSYKKRTYPGMTGNFILDSRQGPGMEVWQDASLTAGRYELHAVLYNDYGNRKPAKVKGSILTVKGRQDLPAVELTMKNNPEATYIFNVDAEGNVTLESK